jgi:beta-xylosidase
MHARVTDSPPARGRAFFFAVPLAAAALPFLLGMSAPHDGAANPSAPPTGGVASAPHREAGASVPRGEAVSSVPRDFADPFVLRDGKTFYAFATGAMGAHLQAASSRDLASWTVLGEALPKVASWAVDSPELTWAPSVLPRQGRYVLYYTARHRASGFQCISRAVASSPAGPYVDDSTAPLVCDIAEGDEPERCGSIDPSPFVDQDGQAYLFWKSDENAAACHAAPHLWSARLSEDGLRTTERPTMLLSMDQAWEGPIIEGPSMIQSNDGYFLFYSANWYDGPDYAIGYATCSGPTGPCTKATKSGPLLASDGSLLGPGGQEFFTDDEGRSWMAYHAWSAPHAAYSSGGVRSLRVAPMTFDGGVPHVETGDARRVEMRGAEPGPGPTANQRADSDG